MPELQFSKSMLLNRKRLYTTAMTALSEQIQTMEQMVVLEEAWKAEELQEIEDALTHLKASHTLVEAVARQAKEALDKFFPEPDDVD